MKKTWDETWGRLEDGDWSRLDIKELRIKIANGWDPMAKGKEHIETVLNKAAFLCKDPKVINLLLKYDQQNITTALEYAKSNTSNHIILPPILKTIAIKHKKTRTPNTRVRHILLQRAIKQNTYS